jgi:hypothetical protein
MDPSIAVTPAPGKVLFGSRQSRIAACASRSMLLMAATAFSCGRLFASQSGQ